MRCGTASSAPAMSCHVPPRLLGHRVNGVTQWDGLLAASAGAFTHVQMSCLFTGEP
jgi:hypothetical protein